MDTATPGTMPEVGTKAPNFEGKVQDGETLRLSDYRGKKVALYFYPKDDTPGCTAQACSLRDHMAELADAGIEVVGVSVDPVKSHQKFAQKYELPFPLVADEDKEIVQKYGVWGEKSRYGKTYMGTNRTTFLIDEDGTIRHIIKKPNTAEHAAEILAAWES